MNLSEQICKVVGIEPEISITFTSKNLRPAYNYWKFKNEEDLKNLVRCMKILS